jgi:hypothetical protein
MLALSSVFHGTDSPNPAIVKMTQMDNDIPTPPRSTTSSSPTPEFPYNLNNPPTPAVLTPYGPKRSWPFPEAEEDALSPSLSTDIAKSTINSNNVAINGAEKGMYCNGMTLHAHLFAGKGGTKFREKHGWSRRRSSTLYNQPIRYICFESIMFFIVKCSSPLQ